MTEINTSAEAVERHLNLSDNHEAGRLLRALADERDDLAARLAEVERERERLALAICGGEDVPGLANSLSVEALESVASRSRSDGIESINMLLRAEYDLATARAETAALIQRAASLCKDMASQTADAVFCGIPEHARIREGMEAAYSKAAILIRALTPADAAAALDEIRRQERAQGMREAAGAIREMWASTSAEHESAILARAAEIEKGVDK